MPETIVRPGPDASGGDSRSSRRRCTCGASSVPYAAVATRQPPPSAGLASTHSPSRSTAPGPHSSASGRAGSGPLCSPGGTQPAPSSGGPAVTLITNDLFSFITCVADSCFAAVTAPSYDPSGASDGTSMRSVVNWRGMSAVSVSDGGSSSINCAASPSSSNAMGVPPGGIARVSRSLTTNRDSAQPPAGTILFIGSEGLIS